MTRDEVLELCLALPEAEETYPFGDGVVVVKVGGRMFALVPLAEGPGSVNLKCDPARALELLRPGGRQAAAGGPGADRGTLTEQRPCESRRFHGATRAARPGVISRLAS